MTIITNPGYQLAPEFNQDFNTGKTILHVGVSNSRGSEILAILQSFQVSVYRTAVRNLEVGPNIESWLEIEGYVSDVNKLVEICDTLVESSYREPETYLPMKPLVINIITIPVDTNRGITHTNIMYPNGTTGLDYAFSFKGIQSPTIPTDLIRYISINVSKDKPVIDNVLPMEQVQPRTAAIFYLSPYKTTGDLNVFVCGNTGEELIEELTSTEITGDIVPKHVIGTLLSSSLTRQYDIARLLNAHKRLYGPISNEIFNTFVMYPYRYSPVLDLLDRQPNASDEELDQVFLDIQP